MSNGLTALRGQPLIQTVPLARAQPRAIARQIARGVGDYNEPLIQRIAPVQGPGGPVNFPTNEGAGGQAAGVEAGNSLLEQILRELQYMSVARIPHVRSVSTNVTTGSTLDWSMVGLMDTLLICNYGTGYISLGFDQRGESVDNFASDQSYALGPVTALNLARCKFYKVGVRCWAVEAATQVISAIAFQSPTGDRGATIA